MDRITRQIRLHGRAQGALYPVSHPRSRQAHLATPSKDLWHRRLGHPTSSIVQSIISNNKLVSSSNKELVEHICDACQQAKVHQLPYELSNRVSTIPLELVHTDVWGPAVKSSGGFRYYVSFLDDFSKFSWVYLLKHKSDVEHVFYQFQKRVERSLGVKFLSVQSDWGGEHQKLHPYFQDTGITHRLSCPHTHQQNGAIERKHRHLVETVLVLLAQACVPLRFWDDAILTACYLINRMPSRVILTTRHPSQNCLKYLFGTRLYAFLGVPAGQIFDPITTENCLFGLPGACFLGTVQIILGSSALIGPLAEYISPMT